MIASLLQSSHLFAIFLVAFFILGPKEVPELSKGPAQGIRSFKDGHQGNGAPGHAKR